MLYEGFAVLFLDTISIQLRYNQTIVFLAWKDPRTHLLKTMFGATSWGDKLKFFIPQASFVGQENAVYRLSHLPVSLTLPLDPTRGPFPFTQKFCNVTLKGIQNCFIIALQMDTYLLISCGDCIANMLYCYIISCFWFITFIPDP